MARKKQQLINYHTSKAIMPQAVDVQLGEIVVRHATDKPELLIKKDNNEFATFVDSGKVQSMITTSSTDLQGKIDAISNNLKNNYATSASTEAAIKAVDDKFAGYATSASTEAAIKAVDKKFGSYATSASTEAAISAVQGNVDKLSNKLTKDYATSASTVAAIKAVDDKFAGYATSASTEAAIKAVDKKFGSYATSASTEAAISAVQGNVDKLSNKLTKDYATSASTKAAIEAVDTKLTRDYATSASTEAAISAVDTKLTTKYADSASTVAAIKVVKDSSDAIGARVTTLEGFTATTNSNVSVVKNGVSLDFDFLNMIVDCGEF